MYKNLGVYIHVPFCDSRCYYCDFYSTTAQGEREAYVTALVHHLVLWATRVKEYTIDTIYFGGGTPSCLTVPQLSKVFATIGRNFNVAPQCEITLEANPEHLTLERCESYCALGINRVSVGLQTADDKSLQLIGRRHTTEDVAKAAEHLCKAGIENFSLDIIGGLPGEEEAQLIHSIDFATSLKPKHISFYLLKLEPGSVFYKNREELILFDEDKLADIYETGCLALKKAEYDQYEISNFSRPGFQSKHNNKYWTLQEYLGIGPSAHSMVNGKRFYYPDSLSSFIKGENLSQSEESEVENSEYLLLGLRLTEGISLKTAEEVYALPVNKKSALEKALFFQKHGLLTLEKDKLALTQKGFLLSNSIIGELLAALER